MQCHVDKNVMVYRKASSHNFLTLSASRKVFFDHTYCSAVLMPLGGTVHPRLYSCCLFVCPSIFRATVCVALSAVWCHCANSRSGLPELIIAFP